MLSKRGKALITLFSAALLFGVCYLVLILVSHLGLAADEPVYTNSPAPHVITEPPNIATATTFSFTTTTVHVGEVADTGHLALVNHAHPFLTNTASVPLVQAWPVIAVNVIEGSYLHPDALAAIANMLADARNDGFSGFFMSSGFRGIELQTQLYAADNGAGYAMPPGHSEHHTGLAADILAPGIAARNLATSPYGIWLAQNAHRFGLILRYPRGAEHITGINFEPWHFRYVGTAHAYFMFNNNLVLEEYIELLMQKGIISFYVNDARFYVLHQTAQDDKIEVPLYLDFTVSNDNLGGYIVTVLGR